MLNGGDLFCGGDGNRIRKRIYHKREGQRVAGERIHSEQENGAEIWLRIDDVKIGPHSGTHTTF